MAKSKSFRIGKVRGDLRGRAWYLTYHENGRRMRPRVGCDRDSARQAAAQINAQLEMEIPSLFNSEPIRIDELQQRWLDHHERILRSSPLTVRRYRTASAHLLRFVAKDAPSLKTTQFSPQHAERFVRYLRVLEVSPNGHPNAQRRPLLDNGVRYVLETCRSMFAFAVKRRHLSPYVENPFAELNLDRMPVEDARPIVLFSPEQEQAFLAECDDWQMPIFLMLMLTGLRPGELTHLLLPEDLDLDARVLRIRNKPRLGWQIKTRNERDVPLASPLVEVLRRVIERRTTGPVFCRRRFQHGGEHSFSGLSLSAMETVLATRLGGAVADRSALLSASKSLWRDAGAIRTDRIRLEFMRVTKRIGLPTVTAPKTLRHLFATGLQDSNVDPLIRCEVMGHSTGRSGGGLRMTATYTHTRPETKRRQLDASLIQRVAYRFAENWLDQRHATMELNSDAANSP